MDPPPGQPGSCVASPSCQALQLSAGESGDLNSWLSHSGALKAALQRLHTEPEGPLVLQVPVELSPLLPWAWTSFNQLRLTGLACLQVDMAAELACFPGLMAALLLQPGERLPDVGRTCCVCSSVQACAVQAVRYKLWLLRADAVHLAVLDKVTQLQPQISRLQRVWIRLIAVRFAAVVARRPASLSLSATEVSPAGSLYTYVCVSSVLCRCHYPFSQSQSCISKCVPAGSAYLSQSISQASVQQPQPSVSKSGPDS